MAAEFERMMPSAIEAEMCCIASMMLDRQMAQQIRRILKKDDFYQADHAIIFEIICTMLDRGSKLDGVLLREELARRQLLEEIGGLAYLAQILNMIPSSAHGAHYARIVLERSYMRQAITISNNILRDMYAPSNEFTAREKMMGFARQLMQASLVGSEIKAYSMEEIVCDFIDRREKDDRIALPTGMETFDRRFLGIFAIHGYSVIGAFPSMGKSMFIKWLAKVFAKNGIRAGIVAVEESRDKIAGNYLADVGNIDNYRMGYQKLNDGEWRDIAYAANELGKLSVYVVDSAFTLDEVLLAVDLLATEKKCEAVFVDHIHLIGAPKVKTESREQELSKISQALKEIPKRLNISLIAAAQLTEDEKEKGKARKIAPPAPRNLKGCKAIGEHADSVILLHRPDWYHRYQDNYMPNNLCQVVIGKNRGGQVGDVTLKVDLPHQRFEELPDGYLM